VKFEELRLDTRSGAISFPLVASVLPVTFNTLDSGRGRLAMD